jgi:G:T/U-mismatch repair DNA glycosylase
MKTHPFKPLIPTGAKKLLVGTLPPESATAYFSNSANTRLWDILTSNDQNLSEVCSGTNKLSQTEKEKLLQRLKVGISDIIFQYDREEPDSTKDNHIIPRKYNDLIQLA